MSKVAQKKNADGNSETLVSVHETTRRHISEDHKFGYHVHENFKSLMINLVKLPQYGLRALEYIRNRSKIFSPTCFGTPWVPSSGRLAHTHTCKWVSGDYMHMLCIYYSVCKVGLMGLFQHDAEYTQ